MGLNFGQSLINLLRFKALFVGIADIKAVLLFREQRDFRKGTTALLAKPQFSLSYNLSLSWQALTFGKIFIYCNKKDKAGLGDVLQIKKADFSAPF